MRRTAVVLGALIAAAMPAVAHAADRFTIRTGSGSVKSIGAFATAADPSIPAAVAAFGAPSSTRQLGDVSCRLGWRSIGLRITFTDLGGGTEPCQTGKAQIASAFGKVWNTPRGLEVGSSTKKLRKLYPGAKRRGSTYRIVGTRALEGGGTVTVLGAKTRRGRVTSFSLFVGSAGT